MPLVLGRYEKQTFFIGATQIDLVEVFDRESITVAVDGVEQPAYETMEIWIAIGISFVIKKIDSAKLVRFEIIAPRCVNVCRLEHLKPGDSRNGKGNTKATSRLETQPAKTGKGEHNGS